MTLQEAITGAGKSGAAVLSDQRKSDRATLTTLLKHFQTLKRSLTARLVTGATDFRRFSLQSLLADTDRLIAEAEAAIQKLAADELAHAEARGQAATDEPLKSVGMIVTPSLPGLDSDLVAAAFGNTADLLSLPMKQFGADVKAGLRRVALAGDNKFEELQRLRDKIEGAGLDNAQFRAERILRTEIGRTFNAAQFARLQDMAARWPFLRKGWRSTKDSRTRAGHVEAGATYVRGAGIKIGDKFSVRVYDERPGKGNKLIGTARLLYPLDPNTEPSGRVSAGATIMCRCNGFADFNQADLSAFNRQRVNVALGGVIPPVPVPVPPPPPVIVPKPKRVRPKAAPKPPKPGTPQKPAQPGRSARDRRAGSDLLMNGGISANTVNSVTVSPIWVRLVEALEPSGDLHRRFPREYSSWRHAKARVSNPNDKKFKSHGRRGITMSQSWRDSFAAFLKDMGRRPKGTTLERVRNNGPYTKSNCRWATVSDQNANRRGWAKKPKR